MRITIVGTGYVGLTTGVCLANKGHEITCVDIDENKIEKLNHGKEVIYEPGMKELLEEAIKNNKITFTTNYKEAYSKSKVIMVCVPTPENEDGSANLTYLNTAIKQIMENITQDCYIIVKSTVPVGTCEKISEKVKMSQFEIQVMFNPEFLSQGEAINNFMNPQRIVVGVETMKAKQIMEEIYQGFDCKKLFMDIKSAEISKYACNNFLALKLTYINEMANLCEKLNINIENVLKVMKTDKRIGSTYLEPGIGYGGSCLPKDTKALVNLAKENKVKLHTIEATIASNKEQRKKLIEKLDKCYENKKDLNVAILGLSFKENTNDLRESQAIETIKELKGSVNKIIAYDNKETTLNTCRNLFKEEQSVYFSNDINVALKDADVCMIFNKEKEILELSPDNFVDMMKEPIILDGKNCFDISEMNKDNIKYDSIGRNVNGMNEKWRII